jgi:3-oxocholest-4-en-26-oyl-CoA dehydrogenase beta subunit
MDFGWSDTQRTLRDLAREILGDRATHERFKELEATGATVFDRDLWRTLGDAGLLGTTIPEAHGGSGLTLLDLVPVLEEAGRHVAPIPLVPTAVAALTLAVYADDDLQATWLPRAAAGDVILTVALDGGLGADPETTTVQAVADGDGWRLTGERAFVPYGSHADLVLVPAVVGDDVGLFAMEPGPGVTTTELSATNRQPRAHLEFAGAAAAVVAAPGAAGVAAVRFATERVTAAWCVVQAGVCEGAIRMLATHASNREQFGKRIAEFQAVAQRAADAFIDTQMVRLTAWQAIHRLAAGWDATKEVHVAKFWAGDGAMRAVHAAQHIHGGLGVDLDYPLHRYFLWAKQIEHELGTPTRELVRLGDLLADEPV